MALTGVILAAGAGTRLGQVGKQFSKAMLPVAGQALVQWVIQMLEKAGVQRLVVVGHPSDAALADLVRSSHGTTLVHQPERRGIADALAHALPVLAGEDAYLACACDSLYRVSEVRRLTEVGSCTPQGAAIGVLDMGWSATATRSAVRVDGERVADILEKPAAGTIDTGLVALPLYWLPRSFASFCGAAARSGNELYVSTALRAFIQAGGDVRAVPMSSRLEITSADDLEAAASALRQDPSWLEA